MVNMAIGEVEICTYIETSIAYESDVEVTVSQYTTTFLALLAGCGSLWY